MTPPGFDCPLCEWTTDEGGFGYFDIDSAEFAYAYSGTGTPAIKAYWRPTLPAFGKEWEIYVFIPEVVFPVTSEAIYEVNWLDDLENPRTDWFIVDQTAFGQKWVKLENSARSSFSVHHDELYLDLVVQCPGTGCPEENDEVLADAALFVPTDCEP